MRGLFDPDWPAEWRSHLLKLGIPLRFAKAVVFDEAGPAEAERWVARPEPWALTFTGLRGAGKTHELARALGKLTWEPRRIPPEGMPYYWEAAALGDWILHGLAESGAMRIRKWSLARAPFLAVDGLGDTQMPGLAVDQIASILVQRHADMAPTLVTTVALERLEKKGWPERLVYRLEQGLQVRLGTRK